MFRVLAFKPRADEVGLAPTVERPQGVVADRILMTRRRQTLV